MAFLTFAIFSSSDYFPPVSISSAGMWWCKRIDSDWKYSSANWTFCQFLSSGIPFWTIVQKRTLWTKTDNWIGRFISWDFTQLQFRSLVCQTKIWNMELSWQTVFSLHFGLEWKIWTRICYQSAKALINHFVHFVSGLLVPFTAEFAAKSPDLLSVVVLGFLYCSFSVKFNSRFLCFGFSCFVSQLVSFGFTTAWKRSLIYYVVVFII